MTAPLTIEDFRVHLNTTFRIEEEGLALRELQLIQVDDLPASVAADAEDARRPFSLIFREAAATSYLAQRIYPLTHPQMGELAVFLVPIGPDRVGMRYEAVFT
jgi:hypothetical protein